LAVHVVALALGDHVVALALGDHVVALALDDHAVALELGELNLDWMRMDDELLSLVVLISFKQLMAFKPFLLGSLHLRLLVQLMLKQLSLLLMILYFLLLYINYVQLSILKFLVLLQQF